MEGIARVQVVQDAVPRRVQVEGCAVEIHRAEQLVCARVARGKLRVVVVAVVQQHGLACGTMLGFKRPRQDSAVHELWGTGRA